MSIKAEITGEGAVQTALNKLLKEAEDSDASVVVSFSTEYAVYVHENLNAHHEPPTQAKFLEQPARELRPELRNVVIATTKKTGSLLQGLLAAAYRLLRAAQELCPVDTGALRASGQVREE